MEASETWGRATVVVCGHDMGVWTGNVRRQRKERMMGKSKMERWEKVGWKDLKRWWAGR